MPYHGYLKETSKDLLFTRKGASKGHLRGG
jgi:hypothetical protein